LLLLAVLPWFPMTLDVSSGVENWRVVATDHGAYYLLYSDDMVMPEN
jgi:hypothetical protein